MKIEVRSFTDEMLPQAGELLAKRHKRNHEQLPLLPARFDDPQIAVQAVGSTWESKAKSGYAAFREGAMIAYLIGEYTTQYWGRCGYAYLPGYALAEDENAAVMQDLYARLGDDWVKNGVFNHGIYISAADANVVESLFDIGFGRERADAILDLRSLEIPKLKLPGDFKIRRSSAEDSARMEELSDIIWRHQSRMPRWHPARLEDLPELAEGWSEIAHEPDWRIWLAVNGEETLGCAGFCVKPESDNALLVPPKSAYLSIAATKETARGRGIAAALTWHGLESLRAEGFEFCLTDWQTANLLASRTWPRFGFETVAYRLARTINPMIAWAKG